MKNCGISCGTALEVANGVANHHPTIGRPISIQNVRNPERPVQPVQDEWGIFDPKQAGLEALLNRLKTSHDEDLEAAKTKK